MALDILFEADLRGVPIMEQLAEVKALGSPAVRPYTEQLVIGVAEQLVSIDTLIASYLPDGWSLDRMPRVDRNLARVATLEMVTESVASGVAISEATLLADALSTDESATFLNGVLASVANGI